MTISNGRTAIVTGGAGGIGGGVVRRLAADGFAVAVLDLVKDAGEPIVDEINKAGGRAIAVAVDVTDEAAVQSAVDEVAEQLGGPTVLINNAGVTRDNMLFKMSLDDWDSVIDVHLRGAFLMSRAAQKHMTEARWGRIVNISSTSALGNRGQVNYSAAKAGLQGFTKTLAFELGKFGVTANAIAPGFIVTEINEEYLGGKGAEMTRHIPVGRFGETRDLDGALLLLASDAGRFMAGSTVVVDGGQMLAFPGA